MKESLSERLLRYFKNNPQFHASGEIQRLVMQHTTQTPRTCVRRLQELAEEGKLERKLVKGHTHYRLSPKPDWKTENDARLSFFKNYRTA